MTCKLARGGRPLRDLLYLNYKVIAGIVTTPYYLRTRMSLVSSFCGAEMDPFITQALADLKDLLREKVISLAQWREEVAALHERARPAPAPVAAGDDDYEQTMALIERTRKLNERKQPRARVEAKEPPAPAPAELTDADFDETDRIIARERALNEKKPRPRVPAPADEPLEAKAEPVEYKAGFYYAAFTIHPSSEKRTGPSEGLVASMCADGHT